MAIWYFYGHLVYFMAIWYILWPLCNVVVIWYIFPHFGILCQGKSGNHAADASEKLIFLQKLFFSFFSQTTFRGGKKRYLTYKVPPIIWKVLES
jgi:hypothetical protein